LACHPFVRALASYGRPPEACLVNFYDVSARMGLHQDRDEAELAAAVVSICSAIVTVSVTAVCGAAIRQKNSNCAPAISS
jgi:2OG-Fe(II) oxygenase superfamily